jgi:hypothetical protein
MTYFFKINTMTCSITDFTWLVSAISTSWNNQWAPLIANGPTKAGLSWGPCYTSCGSLGITDISGLESIILDDPGANMTISTCTLQDYLVLVIPMVQTTVFVDLQVRASSTVGLYPTNPIGSQFINGAPASLSGFLLVSVPISQFGVLETSRLDVDFSIYASWATPTSWPDTSNVLYNSVPWASILNTWSSQFVQYLRSKVRVPFRNTLQMPNRLLGCRVPLDSTQTCTTATTMPNGPCGPCDTCCKCLVEQRCDGDCADCACVNCEGAYAWSSIGAIFLFLVVLFIVAWAVSWSSEAEQRGLFVSPSSIESFPTYV